MQLCMKTAPDLIGHLAKQPEVLAIVEFGSDQRANNYAVGDYDVLAFGQAGDESLHLQGQALYHRLFNGGES